MLTLREMKELLEANGLRPNKALGQNFLCDHNLITRLIDASGAQAGDFVLEVGPGLGALSVALVERGFEVVACELDRGLSEVVMQHFAAGPSSGPGSFRLVRGDCLASKTQLNPEIDAELAGRPFRLIANLPYGAASPLMAILATQRHPKMSSSGSICLGQFVTIQREVGERLRAKAGESEYGELGILVQSMSAVTRIATLPPECFWPRPKVTSEMVSIVPLAKPLTADVERLGALCRTLFTQRRKQVGSTLTKATARAELPSWLDGARRPESLSIEEMESLAAWFADAKAGQQSSD